MFENNIIARVQGGNIPQYLYKYYPDDDNTRKVITQNELYFSKPENFNDPYDCNIPIAPVDDGDMLAEMQLLEIIKSIINSTAPKDVKKRFQMEFEIQKKSLKTLTDDSEFTKRLWDQIAKGAHEGKIDENYTNSLVQFAETINTYKSSYLVNIEEHIRSAIKKHVGICCFSKVYDSILMWSHYGKYHKGVCLKFDITEDIDFFYEPIIVKYQSRLPCFNLAGRNSFKDAFIRNKYTKWSYEKEVRVYKTGMRERVVKCKSEALQEVIFGVKTNIEVIDKYRQLCRDNGKSHVIFFQMKLKQGEMYGLEKVILE